MALLLGAGFVPDAVRTLWAVPRVGPRLADPSHAPIMLVVIVVVPRRVVSRHAGSFTAQERLAPGRDLVPGSVYHVLLCVFAAMPALVQRR